MCQDNGTVKDETPMCQTVWLDFSDGSSAGFLGKAHCFEGDDRSVVGIRFTKPRPLPAGCQFMSEEQMNQP